MISHLACMAAFEFQKKKTKKNQTSSFNLCNAHCTWYRNFSHLTYRREYRRNHPVNNASYLVYTTDQLLNNGNRIPRDILPAVAADNVTIVPPMVLSVLLLLLLELLIVLLVLPPILAEFPASEDPTDSIRSGIAIVFPRT
jgi:hypothetical protein